MTDSEPADLLLGQVDAVIASRVVNKAPHRDFRARVPLETAPILHQAARARGMSVSAYLRRAGLAFAAHDLGLNIEDLLEHEPPTRLKLAGPRADTENAGQGHGPWRIRGLS